MWVFGEQEFHELQESQNFYLVEFTENVPVSLFGHFRKFEQSYPIYLKKYYPDGYDEASFRTQIAQIDSIVNGGSDRYKWFYQLQGNEIFMRNEFRRMCFIIRDVYYRGTFHHACTFWPPEHDTVVAHPGNHLLFALLLLGRPIEAFFTIRKQDQGYLENDFIHVIKRIETIAHLEEIVGTKYTAWLQDASILLPAIVREDRDPLWQRYDRSGFLLWPDLDRVVEWAQQQWWYSWYGEVCEGRADIAQHIQVKQEFKTPAHLYGNLLGFLLNTDRIQEDENFAVLDYPGKARPSIEEYLIYKPSYKDIFYYGNRHTTTENWLK